METDVLVVASPKILFTADLHGNPEQYGKLVDYAIRTRPLAVVLGGDLAPRHPDPTEKPVSQKQFFEEALPRIIRRLKEGAPATRVFLIMGNSDSASHLAALRRHPSLYRVVHNRRVRLTARFDLVGYPFVPLSPSLLKDWEKHDLSTPGQRQALTHKPVLLAGIRTNRRGLRSVRFQAGREGRNSMERDLNRPVFTQTPGKTVYVFHAPPYDSPLDLLSEERHDGSMAIAQFIRVRRPLLTLHGHTHASAELSGRFRHLVGSSTALSVSNNPLESKLALLEIDLNRPKQAKRVLV